VAHQRVARESGAVVPWGYRIRHMLLYNHRTDWQATCEGKWDMQAFCTAQVVGVRSAVFRMCRLVAAGEADDDRCSCLAAPIPHDADHEIQCTRLWLRQYLPRVLRAS
jgi:hypothetical protein